jgi:hypothetical protein
MAETILSLIVISLAVASVSWTVTQEQIFHELQEFSRARSKSAPSLIERKFFYVFTCEYCFSHWVTILLLIITGFQLLFDDWRGYLVAFFVIPWLANQWMSIYRRIRVEIKYENALAESVDVPGKSKTSKRPPRISNTSREK